jgi:hypothetical protein
LYADRTFFQKHFLENMDLSEQLIHINQLKNSKN